MTAERKPNVEVAWDMAHAEQPARDAIARLKEGGELGPDTEQALTEHATKQSDRVLKQAQEQEQAERDEVNAAISKEVWDRKIKFYGSNVAEFMNTKGTDGAVSGFRDLVVLCSELKDGEYVGEGETYDTDTFGYDKWSKENLKKLVKSVLDFVGGKEKFVKAMRQNIDAQKAKYGPHADATEDFGTKHIAIIENEF